MNTRFVTADENDYNTITDLHILKLGYASVQT